mmetsp:Transcript_297/g.181  ORF Transcript_297/g.181 Transcript_297/m.181 type:complete len:90 (+) Transcript_297:79-348(+)
MRARAQHFATMSAEKVYANRSSNKSTHCSSTRTLIRRATNLPALIPVASCPLKAWTSTKITSAARRLKVSFVNSASKSCLLQLIFSHIR